MSFSCFGNNFTSKFELELWHIATRMPRVGNSYKATYFGDKMIQLVKLHAIFSRQFLFVTQLN